MMMDFQKQLREQQDRADARMEKIQQQQQQQYMQSMMMMMMMMMSVMSISVVILILLYYFITTLHRNRLPINKANRCIIRLFFVSRRKNTSDRVVLEPLNHKLDHHIDAANAGSRWYAKYETEHLHLISILLVVCNKYNCYHGLDQTRRY
jgi:ABC-type multidrug transport system fused ATPase/permease subunit